MNFKLLNFDILLIFCDCLTIRYVKMTKSFYFGFDKNKNATFNFDKMIALTLHKTIVKIKKKTKNIANDHCSERSMCILGHKCRKN